MNFKGIPFREPEAIAGEIAVMLKNQMGGMVVVCLGRDGSSVGYIDLKIR